MIRLLLLLSLFSVHESFAQPISWLTDCAEKTFCLNQGSCTQGNVFMVEKATTNCGSTTINYTYKIDLFNNGGVDIQSSEDTVTGNFAAGTHKVMWRASDNCGNIVQCTYLFHVKDCNPPNLICINGLTQTIDPPLCEVTFEVDQFILNLSDNCTPVNQIEMGMRVVGTGTGFTNNQSLTFGICDNGINLLELWVRDAGGLTNQCSNYVLVQSSDPACDCNADSDLSFAGCARSSNNNRLSSYRARTTIKSQAGVQPVYSKVKTMATTDSCFSLVVNEIPFGSDYEAIISADKPDGALNGVTTFDLVLISKHILGIEPLTSAYQLEAADVNNSNSVTTFDIVETRKLILGIYDTFLQVPSWRFVRPLANPADLGSYTAMKDTYLVQLPNLQADLSFQGYQFVGIKYGDVNYSAAVSGPPDDRSDAEPLYLKAEDRWLKAGEEANIEFRLGDTDALDGWQVGLSANPNTIQMISVSGLPESDFLLTGNELRAVSYDGSGAHRTTPDDVIFVLKVKALQPLRLSNAVQLNTLPLRPEAYVPGSNKKTERHPIAFRFESKLAQHATVFGLSPNPFSSQTDFTIELEEPSTAQLEIFTLDGQRVYNERYDLEKGAQSIRLTKESLPRGSMFVYRLRVAGEVFSGKMARVE